MILVLFHPLIIVFFIFSCSSCMQHATNHTILVWGYIFILKSTFGHCPLSTCFSMIDIVHALNWTLKTCFSDHRNHVYRLHNSLVQFASIKMTKIFRHD
jgi:hypothetical protein